MRPTALSFLLLASLLPLWQMCVNAGSVSFQVVLSPTDDSYVQSDNPNAKHGAEPSLEIRYRIQQSNSWFSYALFKFDLSAIPLNATRISAHLNITVDKLSAKLEIGTFPATFNEWNETSVSWKSEEFSSLEKALTPAPSARGRIEEATTYSFDVSEDVRSAVVNGTLTEVIKPVGLPQETSTARATVHSKEAAKEEVRPKLLVTYEVPFTTTTESAGGILGERPDLVQLIAFPAVVLALVAGVTSLLLMARRSPLPAPLKPAVTIRAPPTALSTPAPILVTTGKETLDRALNGGLPPRSAALILTESQDLADDIVDGYIRQGCLGGKFILYVTSRDRESVRPLLDRYPHLAVLVCHPASNSMYVSQPRVVRSGLTPSQISMGRAEVEKLLLEKRVEPKLAVIDLISPLLVEHNPKNVSFWLSEFVQKLKALNFTTISTMNPKMHRSDELAIIANAFDGEIELVADDSESHSIVVRRYTDHKHQTKPVRL